MIDRASQVTQWLKNLPVSAGDAGLISGSGRSHGEGNGNPLQYSCLENPLDRGTWRVLSMGVTKSWTRLSTHTAEQVIDKCLFNSYSYRLFSRFYKFHYQQSFLNPHLPQYTFSFQSLCKGFTCINIIPFNSQSAILSEVL